MSSEEDSEIDVSYMTETDTESENSLNFGEEVQDETDSVIEDNDIHKKSKDDDDKCFFEKKCISDMKRALVNNTKEDPMFYTTLAAITAAVGLATNSPATVIGSMLLSPINNIIIRLSIILNFNAQHRFKKTQSNFSRQAFQEDYLKKLGIPVKYLYVNNNKNNKLNIQLKFNEKGNIDYIYKYKSMVLFGYDDDDKIYDQYGESKFKKDNITNKITNITSNQDITSKIKSVTVKEVAAEIRKNEKQRLLPLKEVYMGKKYKFWDILGWAIIMCIWTIIIGIICSLCFGKFQIQQQREKLQKIERLQERISQESDPEEKISLEKKLENAKSDRVPWFILPTIEMTDRTKLVNAIGMIFIAICAGVILPEATRYNNSIKLVGIGIATALLPPLVNIGMYLGLMILNAVEPSNDQFSKLSNEDIINAIFTGGLVFVINFILIIGIASTRMYYFCNSDYCSIMETFKIC